jgi:hypothetical protein
LGATCLDENHGGDLLGGEGLGLTEVLNLDSGAAVVIDDLEWPRLDILLDGGVIEAATDQTPEQDGSVYIAQAGFWFFFCIMPLLPFWR